MNQLKEKNKKKKQKELRKENQQPPQPRAREIDIEAIDYVPNAWLRGITRADLKKTAERIGMSAYEVNEWQKYMQICGWRFATCEHVNYINFRRSLRMWHKIEEQIREERLKRGETYHDQCEAIAEVNHKRKVQAVIIQSRVRPQMWALCKERCINVSDDGCGCLYGVKIPPDKHPDNPYPPEKCPHFQALEVVS
jgi:hypothetical protein